MGGIDETFACLLQNVEGWHRFALVSGLPMCKDVSRFYVRLCISILPIRFGPVSLNNNNSTHVWTILTFGAVVALPTGQANAVPGRRTGVVPELIVALPTQAGTPRPEVRRVARHPECVLQD